MPQNRIDHEERRPPIGHRLPASRRAGVNAVEKLLNGGQLLVVAGAHAAVCVLT
jgi:hypothetical protein